MSRERRVERLKALSVLLDTAFVIPGTGIRIGLDPILDLIPLVGDLLGLGASAYIVYQAHLLGLPRAALLRMLFNVGVDSLVGAVPVIGTIFDAGWKANARNVALIEQYVHVARPGRKDTAFLAAVLVGLVALVAAVFWITIRILDWGLQFLR